MDENVKKTEEFGDAVTVDGQEYYEEVLSFPVV